MFPKIPENLSEMSAADLRLLARDIKAAAQSALEGSPTSETVAEVRKYIDHRAEIIALAAAKEESARIASELAADESDAEPVVEELAEADDETSDDLADETEAEDEGEPEVEAAMSRKAVRTSMSTGAQAEKPATSGKRVTPDKLLARDGVSGVKPGAQFDSWFSLAQALIERAGNIRSDSSEKFQVAYVPGKFDEAHTLSEDPVRNLRLFEADEILAAMCAPAEPQYELDCWNTDRRPVAASLPGYLAPRGAVTIYPSPSLGDITTGVGVWDATDDANPNAVKEACQTIQCATPVEYRIYGVYRCLTVKNLLAMTFPELVEAYLNRLAAAHARLAERQLLEAMANGADTLNTLTLGYNASTSITSTILNYLALFQEQERWDVGEMDAWVPRWVLLALKADMVRRRTTNGSRISIPSDAEITRLFTEAGVMPHFFIDTPSWATPIPNLQTSGLLNQFPRNLEILVAPRGKFARMDRGELSIGVTGNNLYRDNASNAKNEFTFFFENFEGVVDTNSCPAHILQLDNLCYNGQQIADLVINCEGADEVGAAS